MRIPDQATLIQGIRGGDRRLLAQAITLVESSLSAHRQRAQDLLEALAGSYPSHRVGVTGPPGAGKSCLIEVLGLRLIEAGHRVGVLAIDPSSQTSGGSILGDKTRMEHLSNHPQAFIRPSPAGQTLGGIARRTRETLGILEAAGFDRILIETVGVGQSETAVSQLVDTVLLVSLPGAGDELQGIKRGVMETADVVFVNKSEGPHGAASRQARTALSAALRLLPARTPGWNCPVLTGSALESLGLEELEQALSGHLQFLVDSGELEQRRGRQGLYWLERLLQERALEELYRHPAIASQLESVRRQVAAGELSVDRAADRLWQDYTSSG